MKGRQIVITIFDDSTGKEVKTTRTFDGDDLASPEHYAVEWLKSQEVDHLDG